MNVSADSIFFQSSHGIGQNVAADSLDDVLYELRAIAFGLVPLFLSIQPIVHYRLTAKAILANAGMYIG